VLVAYNIAGGTPPPSSPVAIIMQMLH
jgi:hypothetical protein